MNFNSKISLVLDKLNLIGDKPITESRMQFNYRNKVDINLSDTFIANLFDKYIDLILNHVIILSRMIADCTIYGIIIKESNLGDNMIILKINHEGDIRQNTKNYILEYLLKHLKIDSLFYQINNSFVDHITNHNYAHLYGKKYINNEYELNGNKIITYNHPFAFYRVNHFVSPSIYNSVDKLIIKNKNYSLLTSGRDVSVISMLYHKYYKNTTIFTHCHEVTNDLSYNTYNHDVKIIRKDKKDIPQEIIDNSKNNSIFILTSSRKGINEKFIESLVKSTNIKQVIYMACSHKTVIRDCVKLLPYFNIDNYMHFDEFPRTDYININISLIRK